MPPLTTPLFVTEDAGKMIADLAVEQELNEMLEWIQNNVSNLIAIRVTPAHPQMIRESGPSLVIYAHRSPPPPESELHLADWNWGGWMANAFPRNVRSRFVMMSAFHLPEEMTV